MRARLGVLVTMVAAAALLSAGCSSKRPPAVSAGGTRATPPPSEAGAGHLGQPVDSGPDVRPLDDESAQGRDLTAGDGANGAGGPLADVFFGYDAADLSDEARAALGRHAQWLQAHPGVKVTIEGHCDERGTVDYNLALGDQRARAVHDYLVSLGVAAERLSSVSLGKERPIDNGRDEAAWARNRRAHFAVGR